MATANVTKSLTLPQLNQLNFLCNVRIVFDLLTLNLVGFSMFVPTLNFMLYMELNGPRPRARTHPFPKIVAMAMQELPMAPSAETAQAKKRKGEEATQLQTKPHQAKNDSELMMKLLLNNTQRIRVIEGCLLETYRAPSNHPLIQAMITEARRYAQRTQELGKGHDLGPPTKYVWRAMLRWISENAGRSDEKLVVDEYLAAWAEFSAGRNSNFSVMMRHCKVLKAFDKDVKKIVLCIDLGGLADAVRASLVAAKFIPLEGSAPPGAMERQLQAKLK